MIDWTSSQYIVSQVLVSLAYILFAMTYFVTRRQHMLLTNIIGNITMGAGFALLNGWVAVAICVIATIRDITSSIINVRRKSRRKKKNTKLDWCLLALWLSLFTIATTFTYQGFLSLFAYFSTVVFTISVWQKDMFIYRVLGIFSCLFWVIYNVAVQSVMGALLETILLLFVIAGVFTHRKNVKTRKKQPNQLNRTKAKKLRVPRRKNMSSQDL